VRKGDHLGEKGPWIILNDRQTPIFPIRRDLREQNKKEKKNKRNKILPTKTNQHRSKKGQKKKKK